jgi:hypothetical protein
VKAKSLRPPDPQHEEPDMRVVLYADDMEPITVVDLSPLAHKFLDEHGTVRLPATVPPAWVSLEESLAFSHEGMFKTVTITSERFLRNGRAHLMLFTRDEESAMLLKCAFLPGQRAGLQERERLAFAQGFLTALSKLGEE